MSQRIISPPREDWGDLPTPLTPGEWKAAEFFDRHLPPCWEIYVQPHVNGLQPDFVLLHPRIGVAVYEVKDWNPATSCYWVDGTHGTHNKPTLKARFPGAGGTTALSGKSNPFSRVREYKARIHDICTVALGKRGFGRITAGLIFSIGPSHYWENLGAPFKQQKEPERCYPVAGQDALRSGQISRVFPEAAQPKYELMTEQVADLLRGWLREPDFSRQQRLPLHLNSAQKRLINTDPGRTGLRRMRGPAGSGKSLVLAARAACLASTGKRVMVVGFNITLTHYLHDLAVRHLRSLETTKTMYRNAYRNMIFKHFHGWKKWCASCEGGPEFDAILVDEGHDFKLAWWRAVRTVLKCGGEMMLAFDRTQDIYQRAGAWTEDTMQGAGFSGPWNELTECYRCHEKLLPALRCYANTFMRGIESHLPVPAQPELPQFYPLKGRWVQIDENSDWVTKCVDELEAIQCSLPQDSGYSDVVCLFPEHCRGFEFIKKVKERLGITIAHTFSAADDSGVRQTESRPLKLGFWAGNGQMKATTIHSFKGWEARHMLVYVDDVQKRPALFYTALTRLLRHEHGSTLTVVSSCPGLREFGNRFFPVP